MTAEHIAYRIPVYHENGSQNGLKDLETGCPDLGEHAIGVEEQKELVDSTHGLAVALSRCRQAEQFRILRCKGAGLHHCSEFLEP